MPGPSPQSPPREPPLARRLLWFGCLWLAGVLTLAGVAAALRLATQSL